MLVNVYGSQDLFVNEYRTLLADRLLSQLNYQTERELRHLELLKRRFGEHQLHHCEVMIKDVNDSKKIDENIQSDLKITTLQKQTFQHLHLYHLPNFGHLLRRIAKWNHPNQCKNN